MKTNLLFDFEVDKANNAMYIKREFDADLDLVWDAWTKPELLDKWWAPKPYRVVTKSMNFKEGGFWHYAMVSPQDEKHWCRADYQKINTKKSYSYTDAFCDENGIINTDIHPGSKWENTFAQNGDTTTVSITITYKTLEDLEKIMGLGFKEGFTMCIGNLDELLAGIRKK